MALIIPGLGRSLGVVAGSLLLDQPSDPGTRRQHEALGEMGMGAIGAPLVALAIALSHRTSYVAPVLLATGATTWVGEMVAILPSAAESGRMATIQLVVDCSDPARLVPCWAAALDYVPAPPPAGSRTWREYYISVGVPMSELPEHGDACDRVVDPSGVGPAVWFQVVPEAKVVKNRLHVDIQVGGGRSVPLEARRALVQEKVAVLTALGARVLHTHDGELAGHYATTLADPEGNEFCVV